jgi:Fe2+ or Zn2+ uptake regulation protein
MRKAELTQVVENCRAQTKEALQTVYDALNQGQQKKIVKDEKVKALFDLYEVEYTSDNK